MTLQLENYGVSELSHLEQRETDGGNPWIPLFVAYVLLEAALNPAAHIAAFKAGYNSVANSK